MTKRSTLGRRRRRRGQLLFERLENRVVLDGQLGSELADGSVELEPPPVFSRFDSPEQLAAHLLDVAVSENRGVFGRPARLVPSRIPLLAEAEAFGNLPMALDAAADSVQDTNVQVPGVDEVDLVKTDGEYIYVVRHGQLSIIDARVPDQLALASQVMVGDRLHYAELHVNGDRLALVSQKWADFPVPQRERFEFSPVPGNLRGVTSVVVFDISEPTLPTIIHETEIEGQLVASRRIEDFVYVVSRDYVDLPRTRIHCIADGVEFERPNRGFLLGPDGTGEECRYETEMEYRERVAGDILEIALPHYESVDAAGELIASGLLAAPENVYQLEGHRGWSVNSISVFDIGAAGSGSALEGETSAAPATTTSVLAYLPRTTYISQDNIYLVGDHLVACSDHLVACSSSSPFQTALLKFALSEDGSRADLVAVGRVRGQLLNRFAQFALDEHRGMIRIATTESLLSAPDIFPGMDNSASENHLFVLAQNGKLLEVIGSLEGLAPGRWLSAARYVGDLAFLSFREFDSLLSIDLSDPANPLLMNDFEVPGDSRYLHPIGDGSLVGLGEHADMGWKPHVSLFDVSNPAAPALADRFLIEESRVYSVAIHEYRAFSYFEEQGVLALSSFLPARNSAENGSDSHGENGPDHDNDRRYELWVFQIDPSRDQDRIQLLGKVAHESWIYRTVRIGERMFVVSDGTITVHHIVDPTQTLGELYYGPIGQDDRFEVDVEGGETVLDVLANDFVDPATAEIISVGPTDAAGSSVRIDELGRVLYTPPRDAMDLHDAFAYEVRTPDGRVGEAEVRIHLSLHSTRERMVRLARQDLARRLGVEPEDIHVRFARFEVWPDGCLGLPTADFCTQALVPGFLIELGHGGVRYRYHTDTGDRVEFAGERGEDPPDFPMLLPDRFQVEANSRDNVLDVMANDFPFTQFIRQPEITAVSEPSAGGEVSISEDFYHLVYSPPENFVGVETFTYWVGRLSAEVRVRVGEANHSDNLVEFRLEVTDLAGNVLEQASVGQQLLVNVWVEDLRSDPHGVFAAYLDLFYSDETASLSGEIQYGSTYPNGHAGDTSTPGLIDDFGAFAGLEELGSGSFLLASVPLLAERPGELLLEADPADLLPHYAVGVYGLDDPVPHDQIDYGSATVQIVNGFQNANDPTDVNGDGETSPLDALILVNYMNENGVGLLSEMAPPGAAVAEGEQPPHFYLDVNGDMHLSSLDALGVINRLQQLFAPAAGDSSALGEGEAGRVAVSGQVPVTRSDTATPVFQAGVILRPASHLPASARSGASASRFRGSAAGEQPGDAGQLRTAAESATSDRDHEDLLSTLAQVHRPATLTEDVFGAFQLDDFLADSPFGDG